MAKNNSSRIPRRISDELKDDRYNYIDKELESEKRSQCYSTEKINKILELINHGEKADMMPFFHGKIEWRNSDIKFEYTPEEWEELLKIYSDPVYFVEKYCTFLTDKGRRTVLLRKYQKEVVHMICDEVYDKDKEIMKPKNRKICLLQSRQTGKCIKITQNIHIFYKDFIGIITSNSKKYSYKHNHKFDELHEYVDIPMYELYFYTIENPTLLDKLTYKMLRNGISDYLVNKCLLKKFGSEHTEKLIYTKDVSVSVKSPIENTKSVQFHITKPFYVYKLILDDDLSLECADEHLVYCKDNKSESWKHIKDINIADFVLTEYGWKEVMLVYNTNKKEFMCDLTVDNEEHSYYTNSIVSHNTTTTAASVVYYILTHTDRNVLIVANKNATAEDVLGKVADFIKGLPYWLSCGVKSVSKNLIAFENGCTIRCSATTSSAAVGQSVALCVFDEAGILSDAVARPFWVSIFPTLSASDLSQMIVMSTPRGKHNLFAEIYFGSVAGTNGFVNKRVHWSEVPGRDELWKAEQIAAFGEANFNLEFDLSFDSDGSKLISPNDLKFAERIRQFYQPVDIYGIPWSVAQKIYWHPDFHPDRLTEQDLLTSRFLLKIDTAEGKMKGQKGQEDPDWNIINIFKVEFLSPSRIRKNRLGYKQVTLKDCIRLRQVGIYMDQDHDEEHSAEAAKYIIFNLLRNGQSSSTGQEIDNTRISLEINFNGVNWIKEFSKHDFFYSSLILKTFHSQKATRKEFGFKTVSGARGKGYWCEEGAKLISRRQIIISQDHNIANCSSIQQLQSFGKTKSGSYDGDGMHDDIATTVLFCSIDFENEDFIMWLEDWFRILPELQLTPLQLSHLTAVGRLLDMYVESYEDEYTEADIAQLYGNAASGFGQISNVNGRNYNAPVSPMSPMMNNPYSSSSPYSGNVVSNPYLQQGSMYQQMGGVMMPRRGR